MTDQHDPGHAPAGTTRVFVPCPACSRAVELPLDGPLPAVLTCPECRVELRRSSKPTLSLVETTPRRASA